MRRGLDRAEELTAAPSLSRVLQLLAMPFIPSTPLAHEWDGLSDGTEGIPSEELDGLGDGTTATPSEELDGLGNGTMVHAPQSGDVVKIGPIRWWKVVGVVRPG